MENEASTEEKQNHSLRRLLEENSQYFWSVKVLCVCSGEGVASAISTHLGPKYIKLPLTEEAVKEKATSFIMLFTSHNV